MNVVTNLGIGKNIGTLLDNAGNLVNKTGVGEATKGVTQGATDAVDGASKSIKKLLGD